MTWSSRAAPGLRDPPARLLDLPFEYETLLRSTGFLAPLTLVLLSFSPMALLLLLYCPCEKPHHRTRATRERRRTDSRLETYCEDATTNLTFLVSGSSLAVSLPLPLKSSPGPAVLAGKTSGGPGIPRRRPRRR